MKPHVRNWILTGALALAVFLPAGAQRLAPAGLPNITPYTGLLTPYGYRPPSVPTDTIIPYSFIAYPVPQAVYVPVAVTPQQPAVQPVQVLIVTLKANAAPAELRVRRGTVVTWVNAGAHDRTFVVDPQRLSGISAGASRQSGVARPNASYSLAFYQPGVYQYYFQDQPDRLARITVEE
jgi:plastocyanin